jgi:glycosyltransferase involved in cell wall biosynthesis
VNVGLVVPGFSADPADWCIPALRHLARTLAEYDDVRVIALRYPYAPGRYRVDGAEVIALGGALSHRAATLALWRQTLSTLRAEHRRKPFDVLHAFWATESGLLAALAGRTLGVPTLVSLAGGELVALRDISYGDQRLAWERFKIAASLQLATRVSAGSRQMQSLAQRHVRRHRRVDLAPLGVDADRFFPIFPTPEASEQYGIVHVGTLTPVKDHATLLRAFAEARRTAPDARLDIVGDGPLEGLLRHLCVDLGLADSVCFHGGVDHAALPTVYRGARACVVSSRHEAQCMVALEAAACGVPLVGTRVGVLPEITSAVVPVGDHHALAQALVAALHGDVASCDVRPRFALRPTTDRFRALYRAMKPNFR